MQKNGLKAAPLGPLNLSDKSFEKLGKDVRVQGGQGTGTMSELVFNPATGEFETKAKGEDTEGSEIIVTEMTKEGFAI